MRITVYCPHYEDAGGVREVVRRLGAGMTSRGHAISMITRAPGGPDRGLPAVDPETGAPVARVRLVRAPYPALGIRAYRRFVHRFPGAAVRLVRALRESVPELVAVHCTKFHAPYVLAMRAAVRSPIVLHLHNGAETADGPESPHLQRLLQRCAARIIAVSPAVADYARACLPARASRVTAIPNGSNGDDFAGVSAAERPRQYVLGVGRLARQKGFDVLIDALAIGPPDVDLVLAGDGPEQAALARQAAARGVATRTHFAGHVDRQTVAALLRGATVVAIPSRFEGYPLICLEAMRAGAPIVASALPGLPPEMRDGETGVLVPVEDAAALAAGIGRLLSDGERRRALGHAAREAARAFPTWSEVTERVLGEYARALVGP